MISANVVLDNKKIKSKLKHFGVCRGRHIDDLKQAPKMASISHPT